MRNPAKKPKKQNQNRRTNQPTFPTANMHPSSNFSVTHYNGYQPLRQPVGEELKFLDLPLQSFSVSSIGNIIDLTPVTQGIGVSQRIGDSLKMQSLTLNYSSIMLNSDLNTTTRIIIFQWVNNSGLSFPAPINLLQNVDVYGFYNWEASPLFRILDDFTVFQTGLATAPTDSGNQGQIGRTISLSAAHRMIKFTAGITSGADKIFMFALSDSLVAPFPLFNFRSRFVYYD
jgi:hypothetical protein